MSLSVSEVMCVSACVGTVTGHATFLALATENADLSQICPPSGKTKWRLLHIKRQGHNFWTLLFNIWYEQRPSHLLLVETFLRRVVCGIACHTYFTCP